MDDSTRLLARIGFDQRIGQTFRTVVLQPTSLCNLDCDYCYLPGRKKRNEILPMVVRAVAASIAEQDDDEPVEVVWHGGEPTALPITTFNARLQPFEDLRVAGRVEHAIQTNATRITRNWCELFDARLKGGRRNGPRPNTTRSPRSLGTETRPVSSNRTANGDSEHASSNAQVPSADQRRCRNTAPAPTGIAASPPTGRTGGAGSTGRRTRAMMLHGHTDGRGSERTSHRFGRILPIFANLLQFVDDHGESEWKSSA